MGPREWAALRPERQPSAGRARGRGRRLLLRRGWLDPEHAAVLVIDQHVEEFVRPLPDVADAHPQRNQQGLPAELFELVVDQHSLEVAGARDLTGALPADKDVALPLR